MMQSATALSDRDEKSEFDEMLRSGSDEEGDARKRDGNDLVDCR